MATLKEIFEANTDDIIIATTKLMNELADREGLYVWKKFEYEVMQHPETTLTFTQENVGNNPAKLKVTCSDIDLTKVDTSFFDGVSGTVQSTSQSYVFNEGILTIAGATNLYYRYDPASTTIIINTNWGEITWGSTVRLASENGYIRDFIDYIVSDDPTAYPDGGIQDGYWYEKVSEFDLGFNKVETGNLLFTTDTVFNSVKFKHNLNTTPRFFLLYAEENVGASGISFFIMNTAWKLTSQSVIGISNWANPTTSSIQTQLFKLSDITLTNTEISMSSASAYLLAGINYHFIACA